MALSFYWHDYETFGLDPRRDRPAQFAGLRTDAELNIIGEPLLQYCQPAPDFLPDPTSCLITGISPQQARRQGVAEAVFFQRIQSELARPGTVGVGYNTLRFDDEVTRFGFWRNLIDPYGREWQNDCGRWDLLDCVRACYALRPEGIVWPQSEGRVSFRLELLTAANGLGHEQAHDALSDVQATIALAQLLRQKQPRLFEFCLKLRQKQVVAGEVDLINKRPFLHVSGMFGSERGNLALMAPLAMHPSNKNELIAFDLSQDPAQLYDLDVASLRQRLFTRSADLPAGVTRLGIKTVHLNKSPVLIRDLRVLAPQQAERWGIDLALGQQRAEWLAAQASLGGKLTELYQRPPTMAAVRDVDGDLYGGFIGNGDRKRLDELRQLSPATLAQKTVSFDDGRLEELLFRYRARNYPETLTAAEQQRWSEHCHGRLFDSEQGLDHWLAELDRLAAEPGVTAQQEALLAELAEYGEQLTEKWL